MKLKLLQNLYTNHGCFQTKIGKNEDVIIYRKRKKKKGVARLFLGLRQQVMLLRNFEEWGVNIFPWSTWDLMLYKSKPTNRVCGICWIVVEFALITIYIFSNLSNQFYFWKKNHVLYATSSCPLAPKKAWYKLYWKRHHIFFYKKLFWKLWKYIKHKVMLDNHWNMSFQSLISNIYSYITCSQIVCIVTNFQQKPLEWWHKFISTHLKVGAHTLF